MKKLQNRIYTEWCVLDAEVFICRRIEYVLMCKFNTKQQITSSYWFPHIFDTYFFGPNQYHNEHNAPCQRKVMDMATVLKWKHQSLQEVLFQGLVELDFLRPHNLQCTGSGADWKTDVLQSCHNHILYPGWF